MAGDIEGGVNGVAGARMVEGKVEQRLGRQAGAGPAQPDARRRQIPQVAQRTGPAAAGLALHRVAIYSAGTEASRSRIE